MKSNYSASWWGWKRRGKELAWNNIQKTNIMASGCISQFSRSVMSNSAIPGTAAHQASLYIASPQSLLKLMSVESVTPSHRLILCHPLLLLPSIFPSITSLFRWVSSSHQAAKSLDFQLSISPFNEYSGLISFRYRSIIHRGKHYQRSWVISMANVSVLCIAQCCLYSVSMYFLFFFF